MFLACYRLKNEHTIYYYIYYIYSCLCRNDVVSAVVFAVELDTSQIHETLENTSFEPVYLLSELLSDLLSELKTQKSLRYFGHKSPARSKPERFSYVINVLFIY